MWTGRNLAHCGKWWSQGLLEKCNRLILDRQVVHDVGERLEKRLGRLHARLRLGIEADHEAQVFGQGIKPKTPKCGWIKFRISDGARPAAILSTVAINRVIDSRPQLGDGDDDEGH